MAFEGVVISQIDRLPDLDRAQSKVTYMALGCVACPNKICLQADGVDKIDLVTNPKTLAAIGLDEAILDLDHKRIIDSYGITGWYTACKTPCNEAEEIRNAAISINRRFGKSIKIPKRSKDGR